MLKRSSRMSSVEQNEEETHQNPSTRTDPEISRPLTRSYVACKRCHTQKVKCSGGNPCRNCQLAKSPAQCVYPVRDRKIMVLESYVKSLEAENKALKRKRSSESVETTSPGPRTSQPLPVPNDSTTRPEQPSAEVSENDADNDVPNPLVEERARFAINEATIQPLYSGEASCAAFGTRLRQYAAGNDTDAHLHRARYYKNKTLYRMTSTDFQLPNRNYAQLLVRVVVHFVGSDYHLLLKKRFMEQLDETYRASTYDDPIWLCRLFLIFALGELYTAHSASSNNAQGVPGTAFFMRAMSLFQDLHEEATVSYIETLLLMSFYSHALNRKNSAYATTGLALRLSLTLGLHRNIPEGRLISPLEREHRVRVWWTVYTFDRMCSVKLGHPIMIQDEDIDVDMPSMNGLSPKEREEFSDPAHLTANVQLTRITGDILSSIYRIPKQGRPSNFVQSVHKILKSLNLWYANLPGSLQLDGNSSFGNNSRHIKSLHLHFNQCVILTTRPILFYLFKTRFQNPDQGTANSVRPLSPVTSALAEACIHAARMSNKILTELWVEASIAMFGYFDASYIFSSTIILMMAAIISPHELNRDSDAVETAWSILGSMRDSGNVPASDYYDQLVQLKPTLDKLSNSSSKPSSGEHHNADEGSNQTELDPSSISTRRQPPQTEIFSLEGTSTNSATILDDPFIQNFLMQTEAQFTAGSFGVADGPTVPWGFEWEDLNVFGDAP